LNRLWRDYILILLGVMSCATWASPPIATLFTTPEQRQAIDDEKRLMSSRLLLVSQRDVDVQVTPRRTLFFETLLRTEKGYSIWLNGQLIEDEGLFHGMLVSVNQVQQGQLRLQTTSGTRRLSVGQIYWVDLDKITESYEQP
jgi:hypothetical protein